MKKKWLGIAAAVLCVCSLPVFGSLVNVTSNYNYLSGQGIFRYIYTVTTNPGVDAHWFSVALNGQPALTGGQGQNGAFMWLPMQTPQGPVSFDAFFMYQKRGVFTMSFDSIHGPTQGTAMVTGLHNGTHYSETNTVWTPIPEPTTLALLTIGMGIIARRKRA